MVICGVLTEGDIIELGERRWTMVDSGQAGNQVEQAEWKVRDWFGSTGTNHDRTAPAKLKPTYYTRNGNKFNGGFESTVCNEHKLFNTTIHQHKKRGGECRNEYKKKRKKVEI
jgi:hypothetical protein